MDSASVAGMPLRLKSYLRGNPKWMEPLCHSNDLPYTLIPKDAPRSSLQLPLRCFNCDFVVNNDKYCSLTEQRWRLSKHECGKSGHHLGPCAYSCLCGESFTTSMALRAHCRDQAHALPKRYCTEVEVEAMKTLPEGLGLHTNQSVSSLSHSDHKPRALDMIFTAQLNSRIEKDPESQRHWEPTMRDGLLAYRTPELSPASPSSSGSRRNRCSAHYFNALQGSNSDSLSNTGCVKVYRGYCRYRSPPAVWPPPTNPFEDPPSVWPARPPKA